MGYIERREKIYAWMQDEGIDLVMFEDCEHRRSSSVRYLSGHPCDALLFLQADKKSVLVPWDINMAKQYAQVDQVLDYSAFDLNPIKACVGVADALKIRKDGKIEIPQVTSYPDFLKYVQDGRGYDFICREYGVSSFVEKLRSIKDVDEIEIYRKVSQITNDLINLISQKVQNAELKTESDVALFIEEQCRVRNCEGTGFTTLAAGAQRSFGIHCFPSYTDGPFASKGLSILDFGVVYHGYTSDVTMTFACGALSNKQQMQLDLVKEASAIATSKVKLGESTTAIAKSVDDFFKKHKVSMPHGLGHGIGLQAHEAPYLRKTSSADVSLENGMIFTIEPGLYDLQCGGCRFENDILLIDGKPEVLTKSQIVVL
ncbi:MAG: Xaa-Pro peptidase family protein [Termitinemataceae bacterium]|nr:MAG: Xaa-Pro peptidase family protein [Termitinemataceae bacterium]